LVEDLFKLIKHLCWLLNLIKKDPERILFSNLHHTLLTCAYVLELLSPRTPALSVFSSPLLSDTLGTFLLLGCQCKQN